MSFSSAQPKRRHSFLEPSKDTISQNCILRGSWFGSVWFLSLSHSLLSFSYATLFHPQQHHHDRTRRKHEECVSCPCAFIMQQVSDCTRDLDTEERKVTAFIVVASFGLFAFSADIISSLLNFNILVANLLQT